MRPAVADLLRKPSWEALLTTQCRVFALTQAHEHGIARHAIRAQVDADRWQRVHPRIYAAHNGPLTKESLLWAAVLYAGPGSVLCLRSAAHAWGLTDTPPQVIDVLVEGLTRLVAAEGVCVHRTRRPVPGGDVRWSGAPPRTSVERTVLDLAETMDDTDDVCELVARAVRTRSTTGPRLVAALEARGHVRHRRLLTEVIELAGGGAESVLEVRFAQVVRSHALPEPARQVWHRENGRAFRFDGFYEAYQLAVELDGQLFHSAPAAVERDRERDNLVQDAGLGVHRISGRKILADPCGAARGLAQALHARGWGGDLRPCRDCA